MLTFGPKINRSYSLHLPFNKSFVTVELMFNKMNSYLGFNIDHKTFNEVQSNKIHYSLFRDIRQSSFSTTFLDIRNFKTKNLDVENQFHNIYPDFQNKIGYCANETIKLCKVRTKGGEFDSVIFIYVFNIIDYGDEFLYIIAERQHIDVALDKKVVRTCGAQLCNQDKYEDFLETVQHYNTKDCEKASDIKSIISDAMSEQKRNERLYERAN